MSQVQIVTPRAGFAPGPFATTGEALRRLERSHGRYTGWWQYEDADRNVVALVLQWDTARGPVRRTISRRPGGGWALAPMPRPWLLYGLAAVLENPGQTVHVVGQEDAAVAAGQAGLLSVTSAEGTAGVDKTDWQPLAGREVVLLPDHNPAGRWYAEMVAAVLMALEPPARVRIVRLPNLPLHADIRAWLETFPPAISAATVATVRARMEELVAAVPPLEPPPRGDPPVLQCLAEVAPAPVRWLWPGRIPLGRLTLLIGRPGEGKSLLTTDLAARVSTGRPWPDGTPCEGGSVIFICAEDDAAETLRPRLDAHGADVQRVHGLSLVRRVGSDGRPCQTAFSLAEIGTLEEALRACPDCRLVVVDPIGSFLGHKTDAYREDAVRALLDPVAHLAETYGPAVLLVAHRRKSAAGRYADDIALGSRAFTGVARAVWHLTRDPHDETRRLLLPGKNNLAVQGHGLAFRIEGAPPALAWGTEPVDLTANEALAAENAGGARAAVRSQAVAWLRELLAAGPVPALEVRREAALAGYSKRILAWAQGELGIRPTRTTSTGPWIWKLPAP